MSITRTSMYVYFWILMTTLQHWVVECDKLDGYSFPVFTTVSCPMNQSEWMNRSSDLNCTERNGYMCIPNENITQLLEFCYRYPRIPIEKDICLILKKSTSLVEAYSCKQFRNGCPDKLYWSNEVFEYPSCLSIGHRCFLDEPLCKDEGITSIGPSETKVTPGTTNVDLGSTILNTSIGNTPMPDIDGSNIWVWILVIGVFLIIVFTLVCALTCIFIFRRGNPKTLGDGHEEDQTVPLEIDISRKRENFNIEEIPLIKYKNEIMESEGNQDLDDEGLHMPTIAKTLDEENIFGDRSTNERNREQFEEEQEENKSGHRGKSDCVVENQDEILCLDDTRKTSDSSKKDISKEENSSLDTDASDKINSYLKQQGGSDRNNSANLDKDKISREKTEEDGEDTHSNNESLKGDIAGKHDKTLHLDETNETTDPSSESYSEKENFTLNEKVPEWMTRNTEQQEESDRTSLKELDMVGISLDGYEVWKTDMSEGRHKKEKTIPLEIDISGERENFNIEEIPLIKYNNDIKESEGNQDLDDESLHLPTIPKNLGKENIFGDRTTNERNREQSEEEQGEKKSGHRGKSFSDCVVENQDDILSLDETSKTSDSSKEDISKKENSSLDKDVSDRINSYLKQQEDSDRNNSVNLEKDKITERTEKETGVTKSNDESLKTDIAGEHDNTLYLDETSDMTDPSSKSCSEKEYFSLDEEVPEWNRRNTQQQEESDRIILEELEMVGIYLDDYEIWKTEISEKYKELTTEERAVLFCILCSDKNTFILEKKETLTRESEIIRILDVSKNINHSIQTLRSKGFVSIENEKVTFASDDVQD